MTCATRLPAEIDRRESMRLMRQLTSPEGRADPYSVYELARAIGPAVPTPFGSWLVTGYGDCRDILQHDGRWHTLDGPFFERMSPRRGANPSVQHMTRSALGTNPPVHGVLRKAYGELLSPKALAGVEDLVSALVTERLDALDRALRTDDVVDLTRLLTEPLPTEVSLALLGLPLADSPMLGPMAHATAGFMDLSPTRAMWEAAERGGVLWNAYWASLTAPPRDRLAPGSPLAGWLDEHDEPLVREHARDQAAFFLIAASVTTSGLLSDGVRVLLTHPEQRQRLRDDPALVDRGVDELLRYVSPIQFITRFATEEITLPSGVTAQAGQLVHTVLAAANRDPDVFEAPAVFDVARERRRHLAFGLGAHYCLGSGLARLEAATLLPQLFERFDLELADEPVFRDSTAFRGVRELPVRRAVRRRLASPLTSSEGVVAVRREYADGVLTLTLARPDRHNRLDEETLRQLLHALRTAVPAETRVVVLRGDGEHFCTGGDLDELQTLARDDPARVGTIMRMLDAVTVALHELEPVTISALHGNVVGAGVGLALACDLRVAAEGTTLRLPETVLGVPVASGPMVTRVVSELGPTLARRMVLLGEAVAADEALALGLVTSVAGPRDAFDAEVARTARRLARRDAVAIQAAKEALAPETSTRDEHVHARLVEALRRRSRARRPEPAVHSAAPIAT